MTSARISRPAAFRAAALILAAAPSVLPARAEVSPSQQIKARTFQRLNEGIETYRKGEAERAIEILSEVAGVAMNSFRANYYLGLAYRADRQYTKAIEILAYAIELDPTHLQAHVDLGDCYLKRGDSDEALAEYHRSISIQEGYAPAWDGLGRAAEATGDDDRAVEHFRKAIDLNPGFPDSSLNLGDLYLRRERLREAVDLFLKAIAVRPDFAAAYNRLGVAYARQRLGNEAIAALRKAADLEKGNPWHAYTIGLIEMDLGDLSQAGRDFDAALTLDRHYLEAYAAKARLLRRLGDFGAAAALLDEAMTVRSEDEKLKREVAALREEVEAQGRTHQDLTAKQASGAAGADELRALADLRAVMGDHAAAAEALRGVVVPAEGAGGDLDAGAAADLFRFGYHLLRAGSFEEAERTFARLVAARPGSAAARMNLALSLLGQGKNRAADEVLAEAHRLAPDDPAPLLAMGNARVLEGRWADAAAAFEKALAASDEYPGRARVETILKALRDRIAATPPPVPGPAAPGDHRDGARL